MAGGEMLVVKWWWRNAGGEMLMVKKWYHGR
jgi:hypothetical protein